MQTRQLILTLALGVALAPATPALGSPQGDPVRIVTAPAVRQRANAQPNARAYLPDTLGGVPATGAPGAPESTFAPRAADFGLRDAASRAYGDSLVAVYRFPDEAAAFGLFRSLRPEGAQAAVVGDSAWSAPDVTAFWAGPFVAVIRGPEPARAPLAEALATRIGKVSAPAPLTTHLPEIDMVPGSARYAPSFELLRAARPDLESDVFLLERGGAEAVVADYAQPGGGTMRVTLVEYETPQLAADGERSLQAYYKGLAPEAGSGRLTRRKGNYVLEATGVVDEPAALATIDSVDYAYQVKWIKEPVAPDINRLSATDEARKVAQVLVSSFGIVGLGLLAALGLGGLFGAWVFRVRRRAARNAFSDAGGMICLDLDPALPPTSTARLLRAAESLDD